MFFETSSSFWVDDLTVHYRSLLMSKKNTEFNQRFVSKNVRWHSDSLSKIVWQQ